MKKFIGILIVILMFGMGAGGFFLQWAQLSVPLGIRSRFFGIEGQLAQGREYLWHKPILANVEVAVFIPSILARQIRASGTGLEMKIQ